MVYQAGYWVSNGEPLIPWVKKPTDAVHLTDNTGYSSIFGTKIKSPIEKWIE